MITPDLEHFIGAKGGLVLQLVISFIFLILLLVGIGIINPNSSEGMESKKIMPLKLKIKFLILGGITLLLVFFFPHILFLLYPFFSMPVLMLVILLLGLSIILGGIWFLKSSIVGVIRNWRFEKEISGQKLSMLGKIIFFNVGIIYVLYGILCFAQGGLGLIIGLLEIC